MLKIGDFSKLSMVSVKALRYYDELGLLKPAQIDKFSGYRYYAAGQLAQLNRILALKDMGLSLEQIAALLKNGLPLEQLHGMLRLKQAELIRQIAEEQTRLERVSNWLAQFEQEALAMSEYAVIVKKTPAVRVAVVHGVAPDWQNLNPAFNRLFDEVMGYVNLQGGQFVGPGIALYYDSVHRDSDISIGAAMPVGGSLPESDTVKLEELPAVETMATVIHNGSFSSLNLAYKAIMDWIEANGYQVNGHSREVYLEYDRNGDQSKYVTEIQFPVSPNRG